jgi:FtsH-binding integral membrane protein
MEESLFALLFAIAMFCGVFVIFLAMRQRSEVLERHHRERMAMIERGQIPLPDQTIRRGSGASSRALSVGIIVVGLGLSLMTIISVAAGAPDVGIGIGGAIVILGASFIVRSFLVRPESQNSSLQPPAPPPAA